MLETTKIGFDGEILKFFNLCLHSQDSRILPTSLLLEGVEWIPNRASILNYYKKYMQKKTKRHNNGQPSLPSQKIKIEGGIRQSDTL